MTAALDVSDVVNITQDKIADGEEILDVMEKKRRDSTNKQAWSYPGLQVELTFLPETKNF